MKQATTFAVALLVVVLALGSLEYYSYETINTQLSNTKADLSSQIDGLQNTVTSLQNSLTSLQNTVTSQQNSITSLQNSVASMQNSLTSLQNTVSQNQQAESTSVQQISSQLQNITQSINAIKARLSTLFPQVPNTTLVITHDVYNTGNVTFTFTVKNTQDYTVRAQLSATLEQSTGACVSFGEDYNYVSQIYTFAPQGTVSVPLDVAASSGSVPGSCGWINEAIVTFILPQSTAISATYDFTVSPTFIPS